MKKSMLCLLILFFALNAQGQCETSYDTIRRNEFSASFLPLFVLFSGYNPNGRYGFYNFSYKHYGINKTVFRFSVSFARTWYFAYENQRYLRTQDTINIFTSNYSSIRNRFQVNAGVEKIFRTKRFLHGLGAELFFRSQTYSIRNPVYWYPTYLDVNSNERLRYSTERNLIGAIYNGIDSLYYSYDRNDIGLGLQLIYTLRYKISSHFYLSSTIGPYLMVLRSTYSNQRGDKARFRSGYDTHLDGHILLISDFSLAYRF